MTFHFALILLHASFATIAFGVGCSLLIALPSATRSPRFIVFYASMVVAVLALLAVVIVDWSTTPIVQRIVFAGLCVLGLYLLVRSEQARLAIVSSNANGRGRFVAHVGFVLISLFDAFCIVSAIDLQLSPFLTVPIAAVAVAVGSLVVVRVRRREAGVVLRGA
jgi:hypothetical protein